MFWLGTYRHHMQNKMARTIVRQDKEANAQPVMHPVPWSEQEAMKAAQKLADQSFDKNHDYSDWQVVVHQAMVKLHPEDKEKHERNVKFWKSLADERREGRARRGLD